MKKAIPLIGLAAVAFLLAASIQPAVGNDPTEKPARAAISNEPNRPSKDTLVSLGQVYWNPIQNRRDFTNCTVQFH